MQQYKSPVLVLSNVYWLVPATLALCALKYWLVLPAMFVMVLSMWFHYRPTIITERFDTFFSIGYILLGPFLLSYSPNPVQAWVFGSIVTVMAGGCGGVPALMIGKGMCCIINVGIVSGIWPPLTSPPQSIYTILDMCRESRFRGSGFSNVTKRFACVLE